jgi:NTE family protein
VKTWTRACDTLGLRVTAIVGSSVGGLVGAFAAAGLTPGAMAELALQLRKRDIFDVDYRALLVRQHRARSLYRGTGLRRFVEANLPDVALRDLALPLWLNAVNVNTGQPEVFGPGPCGQDAPLRAVVQAACALPGFFPPVAIGDDHYLDGGVLDPLPVPLARCAGRRHAVHDVDGLPVRLGGRAGPAVVAVHLETVGPGGRTDTPGGMFGLLERAETIRSRLTVQQRLEACADLPLILVAPDVTDRGIFDLRAIGSLIDEGERAALATLTGHALLQPTRRARTDRRPRAYRPPFGHGPRRRPSDTRPIELPRT